MRASSLRSGLLALSTLGTLGALGALAACSSGTPFSEGPNGTGGGSSTSAGAGGVVVTPPSPGDAVWTRRFDRLRDSNGVGSLLVANDAAGRTLLAGTFTGTIDLGAGSLVDAGEGVDSFVAAFDDAGRTLWSTRLGVAGEDDAVYTLAVDRAGTVLVTGSGALAAPPGASSGFFLAALDADGHVLTTRALDEAGTAEASAVDTHGDLVLAGSKIGVDGLDGWVALYDPAGALLWSRTLGGADTQRASAVAVDRAGNVLVGGSYRGAIVLGTELVQGSSDALDGFVAALARDGSPRWHVRNVGAPVVGLAVDPSGAPIALGQGRLDTSAQPERGESMYLQALTDAGERRWMRHFSAEELVPRALAVDAEGNIALTATLFGDTILGDGVTARSQGYDQLVARFNPEGRARWGVTLDDGQADKGESAVAFDPEGRPVVAARMTHGSWLTLRAR